jgi:hypothetical protein
MRVTNDIVRRSAVAGVAVAELEAMSQRMRRRPGR